MWSLIVLVRAGKLAAFMCVRVPLTFAYTALSANRIQSRNEKALHSIVRLT